MSRYIVKNIRSSQVIDGSPKLPSAEQIDHGEIAINYAKGHETISLKNSADEIIPLSISKCIEDVKVNDESVVENKIANINLDSSVTTHTPEGEGAVETTVKDELWGIRNDLDFNIQETIAAREEIRGLQGDFSEKIIEDEIVTATSIGKIVEASGIAKDGNKIGYVQEVNANYIYDAESIHEATVILDAQLKEVEDGFSELNDEITNKIIDNEKVTTEAIISLAEAAGTVDINGKIEYISDITANYIANADSIHNATIILDDQLKNVDNKIDVINAQIIKDEKVTAEGLTKLADAVGVVSANSKIEYTPELNTHYIHSATSISDATLILDDQLKAVNDKVDNINLDSSVITHTPEGEGAVETTVKDELWSLNSDMIFYAQELSAANGKITELQSQVATYEYQIKKLNLLLTNQIVDLGLPSGNLWMTRNIGAALPSDTGLYFQWGDIVGRNSADASFTLCNWLNAPFNGGNTTYNAAAFAAVKDEVCPNDVLSSEYDAATQILGTDYRMGTAGDFQELYDNTNSVWTTLNGVNGRMLTSKINGNTLFLPVSGYISGNTRTINYGTARVYSWTSSLISGTPTSAYSYYSITSTENPNYTNINRSYGIPIRGIFK